MTWSAMVKPSTGVLETRWDCFASSLLEMTTHHTSTKKGSSKDEGLGTEVLVAALVMHLTTLSISSTQRVFILPD